MKISGKIVDKKLRPISFANLMVFEDGKPLKIGTYTNLDGCFCLENELIKESSLFEISFRGFPSKKIKACELQDSQILLDSEISDNPVLNFGLLKKNEEAEKPKLLAQKTKNNFNKHLFSHREKYAIVFGLLGVLIIFKSLKK